LISELQIYELEKPAVMDSKYSTSGFASTLPTSSKQIPAPQVLVYSDKVVSSNASYITKIVLGSASILTALIIIGVGGGLMAKYPIDSAFRDVAFAFPPVCWPRLLAFYLGSLIND
jgi:hypothetical protein